MLLNQSFLEVYKICHTHFIACFFLLTEISKCKGKFWKSSKDRVLVFVICFLLQDALFEKLNGKTFYEYGDKKRL